METLTPQQVRRVCTAYAQLALVSVHTRQELTPPGLHGLRYAASSYIPYYNMAAELTCTASWRDGGIWYTLEALRRCDTLQRVASGVMVDCIGLVSLDAEREQSKETPL